MRPMKDSGIAWLGQVPREWQVERLQWFVREVKESNNPIKTTQVLSLTNNRGVIPYEEKGAQGNVAKEDYSQYKVAYPNTIIANSMNILIGSVGMCVYYGCVSPVYYVYKILDTADIRFINYIFQTVQFQKELRKYANGILEIRLRVTSADILKRKIAIPPLAEQQAIADYLDEKCAAIDKLIDNQKAQIEKMKEYKQSVITEAVTKGLNPSVPMKDSGIEWIGKIPEGWEMDRLKYVATYNDEVLPENLDGNTEIKYIDIGSVSLENGIEHIEEFSFRDAPSRARRVTNSGDIIVSTVRTYLKAIAKIKQNGLIVSTGFCVIRPIKSVCGSYIEYYCKSNAFTDNVSSNSYGISYPAINSSVLMGFYIPSPPLAEQQAIADYLDEKCAAIDRLIAVKQAKIDKLNDYKKSLIYEYVTGKREVL